MSNFAPLILDSNDYKRLPATDAALINTVISTDVLILQPASTKALQLSSGGNARGLYAVDLQNYRTADTQVASGTASIVIGGRNTSSNSGAICIGDLNTASGSRSIAIGYGVTSSGTTSLVLGGASNVASAAYSIAQGLTAVSSRQGQRAFSGGRHAANGDCQCCELTARTITTNDTITELFLDTYEGTSASSLRITFVEGQTAYATVKVIGRQTNDDRTVHGCHWEGIITRNTSGNVTITNSDLIEDFANDMGWSVTIDADTANQALRIRVQGGATDTIRWQAYINLVEVKGA